MGRALDALLRRDFRASKFKALVKLAISRASLLKNQHQVRCSHARSDILQLLNLGHHDSALLRVEHVIKEQNLVDVFLMIEHYCSVLLERLELIKKYKECPDELKEAISSLIFACSRFGVLPELQQIREIFTSRFGKEFAAHAVELHNNCGVNPKMFRKLSTRQPSLETILTILKEIASENNITLHLKEDPAEFEKDKSDVNQRLKPEPNKSKNLDEPDQRYATRNGTEESNLEKSDSVRARKKYTDVGAAAHEAFTSAAYAAAAAKAAVKLSRPGSGDNDSQDLCGSGHETIHNDGGSSTPKNKSDTHVTPKNKSDTHVTSEEIMHSKYSLIFDKIHPADSGSSASEDEHKVKSNSEIHPTELGARENAWIKRTSTSESDTNTGENAVERKLSSYLPCPEALFGSKIVCDGTDDENKKKGNISSPEHHDLGFSVKPGSPTNEGQQTRQSNTVDQEGLIAVERKLSSYLPCPGELLGHKTVCDCTDEEAMKILNDVLSPEKYELDSDMKPGSPINEHQQARQNNEVDEEENVAIERKLSSYLSCLDVLLDNKIVCDDTDEEAARGDVPSLGHHDLGSDMKPTNDNQHTRQKNAVDEENFSNEAESSFCTDLHKIPQKSQCDLIINPVEGRSMLIRTHG